MGIGIGIGMGCRPHASRLALPSRSPVCSPLPPTRGRVLLAGIALSAPANPMRAREADAQDARFARPSAVCGCRLATTAPALIAAKARILLGAHAVLEHVLLAELESAPSARASPVACCSSVACCSPGARISLRGRGSARRRANCTRQHASCPRVGVLLEGATVLRAQGAAQQAAGADGPGSLASLGS